MNIMTIFCILFLSFEVYMLITIKATVAMDKAYIHSRITRDENAMAILIADTPLWFAFVQVAYLIFAIVCLFTSYYLLGIVLLGYSLLHHSLLGVLINTKKQPTWALYVGRIADSLGSTSILLWALLFK